MRQFLNEDDLKLIKPLEDKDKYLEGDCINFIITSGDCTFFVERRIKDVTIEEVDGEDKVIIYFYDK